MALNFGGDLLGGDYSSNLPIPQPGENIVSSYSAEATGAGSFGTVSSGKIAYVLMLVIYHSAAAYLKLLKNDGVTANMLINTPGGVTVMTPYGSMAKYLAGEHLYFEHTANSAVTCVYIEV